MTATGRETQLERTTLAWQRTGLALAGAAVVLARSGAVRGATVVAGLCAVALLLALVTLAASGRAHIHADSGGLHDRSLRGLPAAAPATAVATLALAAAGLVLVVTA
jgi:uncharacterized membrane protein YidH (DUF202 family)